MTMLMTIQLHSASVSEYDAKPAIHQWNLHHNRRPNFMEARRRRAMPETHVVEEALEAAVDGQADEADEAMVASASAPGLVESDCDSDFSELDESDPSSD
jgi:hypothetical protein